MRPPLKCRLSRPVAPLIHSTLPARSASQASATVPRWRAAPNSHEALRVTLRVLGANGDVQWLLDGRRQGTSHGAATIRVTLLLAGSHTITALAQTGAFAHLTITMLAPPK